ncbi:MAG: thiamine ABC transporter substrate-binding protein [Ilumatobacteraceae bacterium]
MSRLGMNTSGTNTSGMSRARMRTGSPGRPEDRRRPAGNLLGCALVAGALAVSACSDGSTESVSVTLVTYDSFPAPDPENPVHRALAEFTDATGIEVEVLVAGDTGTMLARAELTAGNPEGDVIWGIDNTFLSRAVEAGIFEPYAAAGREDLRDELLRLVPGDEATPVDFGDVCVNFDRSALDRLGLDPPTSFDDLADPAYASMLVVQDPASSSPGLAFLLATGAEFGDDGWQAYWERLVANDVEVVDSWTTAYYESFSLAGGDRPLVVSYGSSPPFEVLFAVEPTDTAPTGVVEATCFRQVEFAGVLAGTDAPDAARRLVDFLVSPRFQSEVALNLFVFPANRTVTLDPVFVEYAAIPPEPLGLDPAIIDAGRAGWIDQWTGIVGA